MLTGYSEELYQWVRLDEEQSRILHQLEDRQLAGIEVEGKKICVTRLEGVWLGILDRCPHAGTPLHMGSCNKKGIVVCPTHHYKFDMKSGLSADGNFYQLPVFRFRSTNGVLEIGWRRK